MSQSIARVAGGDPSETADALVATEREVFAGEVARLRGRVESRLDQLVPAGGAPSLAARHSLLAPGKRLRAVLTILAARQCAEERPQDAEASSLDAACAVEMVHTASLVFDDLPAMDDADLRRGAPTPHKLFGDDVAILAGIGLLNGAFGVVAQAEVLTAQAKVEAAEALTQAVGWSGLVQGQAMDLRAAPDDAVTDIHYGKTGALFVAAALVGAACVGAPARARAPLVTFGRELGLAYQALDDVLDQVAGAERTGKSTRKDTGKRTALAPGSPRGSARERAEAHLDAAARAASSACEGSPLLHLTDHVRAHFTALIT